MIPFTEEEKEDYLLQVYAGIISPQLLSTSYHLKVGGNLYEAVMTGFGTVNDPFSIYATKFEQLRKSVYVFSAAKQYSQVREMSKYITKANERASFTEFKKLANVTFDTYNENYLRTEFDTAIGEAQNARQWMDIQKDKEVFPYLQYNTQQDALVRQEHAAIDGVVKRADSPFWDNYMPLNGWNCRCFVTQLEEAEETDTSEIDINPKDFPELFRHNPGKTGKIFVEGEHPYFKVKRGDAPLRKRNFDMPIP